MARRTACSVAGVCVGDGPVVSVPSTFFPITAAMARAKTGDCHWLGSSVAAATRAARAGSPA